MKPASLEEACITVCPEYFSKKGEMTMTGDLIKEVKHIQQCLVNKDMEGEE